MALKGDKDMYHIEYKLRWQVQVSCNEILLREWKCWVVTPPQSGSQCSCRGNQDSKTEMETLRLLLRSLCLMVHKCG